MHAWSPRWQRPDPGVPHLQGEQPEIKPWAGVAHLIYVFPTPPPGKTKPKTIKEVLARSSAKLAPAPVTQQQFSHMQPVSPQQNTEEGGEMLQVLPTHMTCPHPNIYMFHLGMVI